jgi:hypothetical protein
MGKIQKIFLTNFKNYINSKFSKFYKSYNFCKRRKLWKS